MKINKKFGIAISVVLIILVVGWIFLNATSQTFVDIRRINFAITQFNSETESDATYTLTFRSDDQIQRHNAKAGNFELSIGGGHQAGELFIPDNLQLDTFFNTDQVFLSNVVGIDGENNRVDVVIENAIAKCLIVKTHTVSSGIVPSQVICHINADLIGLDKETGEEVPSKFYGLSGGKVIVSILKEGFTIQESVNVIEQDPGIEEVVVGNEIEDNSGVTDTEETDEKNVVDIKDSNITIYLIIGAFIILITFIIILIIRKFKK